MTFSKLVNTGKIRILKERVRPTVYRGQFYVDTVKLIDCQVNMALLNWVDYKQQKRHLIAVSL